MLRCLKPDCHWELAPDDVYCGWCGHRLKSYKVSLTRERIFLDYAEASPDVAVKVENTGQMPISVWLSPPLSPYVNFADGPKSSGPKSPVDGADPAPETPADICLNLETSPKPKTLPLEVDIITPPNAFHTAYITAVADDGEPPVVLSLELIPLPEFELELPLPLSPMNIGQEKEVVLTGSLTLLEGGAELDGLTLHDPLGVCSLKLVDNSHAPMRFPCWLDARRNHTLLFEVKINVIELRRRYCTSGEKLSQLAFMLAAACREPQGTAPQWPFEVPCYWPPLLRVPNASHLTRTVAFPGRRYNVSASLENHGGTPLTITGCCLQEHDPDTPQTWVRLLSPGPAEFPLKIAPRDLRTLNLKLIAGDMPDRTYETLVEIESDSCDLGLLALPVKLTVKEVEPYEGVVAIDFGTTNSCCAFGEQTLSPDVFPLENHKREKADKDTMPSAILYERLDWEGDQEVKTYLVGSDAKYLLHLPGLQNTLFYSIKRRLGERAPHSMPLEVRFRETENRKTCWPQEVAADIIRQGILHPLEDHLKKRISQVVITHPARFAFWQMEALKEAFGQCGVTISHQLSEPVAAALDYMVKRPPANEDYHLVVFDFGGGSTDIALLKVEDRNVQGVRCLRPELIDLDGDPYFGGDNLTDILTHYLITEACEVIRLKGQDLPPFPPLGRIWEDYPYNWVMKTWKEVWKAAEEFKISDEEQKEFSVQIYYTDEKLLGFVPITINKERFNNMARKEIAQRIEIVSKMLELQGIQTLNVILLAGRSCRLPVVEELIGEIVQRDHAEAQVVLAETRQQDGPKHEQLKECVARGACFFGFLNKTLDIGFSELLIEPQGELVLAPSSFGYAKVTHTGDFCFAPVIPMGSRIEKWNNLEIRGIKREILVWENVDRYNADLDRNPRARKVVRFSLDPSTWGHLQKIPVERLTTLMRLNKRHEAELMVTAQPANGVGPPRPYFYQAEYISP
jgi:molecular chaperone DnaK (HSP70)